ncbi:hypothetical protein INT47_004281 [Mucor saturninus]|uniref:FAS1 domain-containing protein n=1 Tax=Mucor saturninus TaxID=64648 RepID=A0A8H7V2A3_9FUNG|nr:hypothetical protein INT47_004281 [Mucor saturninus]
MLYITQLLLFVFWIGLVQGQQHYISQTNVMDLLQNLPETKTLISLLNHDAQTYLTDQQNITFFAPNNNAFKENSVEFNSFYHTLPVYHLDWNMTLFESTSYNKSLLKLSFNNQQKTVESGMMLYANVLKTIPIGHQNSVVHIIDKILATPSDIITTLTGLGFTKAKDMLGSTSLPLNQQLTLFVPNNQAFGTVDPATLGDDLLSQAHVSDKLVTSNLWTNKMMLTSLNGFKMTLIEKSKNDWQGKP